MFERFTDRSRKVVALANQQAQKFNHEMIGTEHVLLGLVIEGSGGAANVLRAMHIDFELLRKEVQKRIKINPGWSLCAKLPQTRRFKKAIEYAIEEARNLNHEHVGTEHILLGLIREHDGVAAQVLGGLGLKIEQVRAEVVRIAPIKA